MTEEEILIDRLKRYKQLYKRIKYLMKCANIDFGTQFHENNTYGFFVMNYCRGLSDNKDLKIFTKLEWSDCSEFRYINIVFQKNGKYLSYRPDRYNYAELDFFQNRNEKRKVRQEKIELDKITKSLEGFKEKGARL